MRFNKRPKIHLLAAETPLYLSKATLEKVGAGQKPVILVFAKIKVIKHIKAFWTLIKIPKIYPSNTLICTKLDCDLV